MLGALSAAGRSNEETNYVYTVPASEYLYFRHEHNSTTPFWIVVDPCTGNPDLLISESNPEPSLQSYTYLSINSKGSESIQITSGPGTYYMAVYGMTESKFRLVIETEERVRPVIPNKGHIHVHSTSPSRVEIMWDPIRIADDFRNLGTTLESYEDGSAKMDTKFSYYVYYARESDNMTRLTKTERLVDTECGMKYLSTESGQGDLTNIEGEQRYFKRIDNLTPDAVYSVNVMAVNGKTGHRWAYSSVLVRTVNSRIMKLNSPVQDAVEQGQYKHYQLQIKNPERFNQAKDNYYQRKDVKLWFNLVSQQGDADIYVSTHSPPTFDDAEFSSEGLQVDRLEVDVFDNTITYFISIYGKVKSTFDLTAELQVGENKEIPATLTVDADDNTPVWVKVLWFIVELIIEAL
jgi:hypothetical protein